MNWYKKSQWNIDDSPEGIEREQWDAQGELQQFLGPDDKNSDLFRENIENILIKDIVSDRDLQDIKMMIDKQGDYGRKTIDKLKEAIKSGNKIPPVTIKNEKRYNGLWKLVSGRHRIIAAIELGLEFVPTIMIGWI